MLDGIGHVSSLFSYLQEKHKWVINTHKMTYKDGVLMLSMGCLLISVWGGSRNWECVCHFHYIYIYMM